jgi:hypothetical protein
MPLGCTEHLTFPKVLVFVPKLDKNSESRIRLLLFGRSDECKKFWRIHLTNLLASALLIGLFKPYIPESAGLAGGNVFSEVSNPEGSVRESR